MRNQPPIIPLSTKIGFDMTPDVPKTPPKVKRRIVKKYMTGSSVDLLNPADAKTSASFMNSTYNEGFNKSVQ
jgi:hypothetical protein